MKKSGKIKIGILTILLISHLINTLEYTTYYQSNAKTEHSYLMDTYENKFIRILINLYEIIINQRKIAEKSSRYTYKDIHISAYNYHRVLNLISE